MSFTAYQGAKAPETLQRVITPAQCSLPTVDLSTVTAATFSIKRNDGSIATFAATLSAQSSSSLTLTYTYNANGLDLAGTLGPWSLVIIMTTPSGTVRSLPILMNVVDQYFGAT